MLNYKSRLFNFIGPIVFIYSLYNYLFICIIYNLFVKKEFLLLNLNFDCLLMNFVQFYFDQEFG